MHQSPPVFATEMTFDTGDPAVNFSWQLCCSHSAAELKERGAADEDFKTLARVEVFGLTPAGRNGSDPWVAGRVTAGPPQGSADPRFNPGKL